MMKTATPQVEWLAGLQSDVAEFMSLLQVEGQSGRFLPCRRGATGVGGQAALGFSCLAHKIYYTTGLWSALSGEDQREWLDFIRSFQLVRDPGGLLAKMHAFVDLPLLDGIVQPWESRLQRMKRWVLAREAPSLRKDAILAETKQAIATLAQVGATPWHPFCGFPREKDPFLALLRGLDWSKPWGAGAKTSMYLVFVVTQGPLIAGVDAVGLAQAGGHLLEQMADRETGSYFLPPDLPQRGQLINGAMKVLTALDWLESPIHYPEQLIDTCLQQGPPPAGCHVVDWVYVVHRCLLQTNHRRQEIQEKCQEIITLIQGHQNGDRGFSYAPRQAQQGYYGAVISRGEDEGDIHGTCLLTWALAMIMEILELHHLGWKPIRP